MSTLDDKKTQRLRFMHALYEQSEGNEHRHLSMWDIGNELGLDRDETDLVVQYLRGEQLLDIKSMGGYIAIAHYGVVQVERALETPQSATTYFPPVVNILHIGSMSGSQINQTGAHSTVVSTMNTTPVDGIRELAHALRDSLEALRTTTSRAAELEATVATLEAQANSPSPNQTIILESMRTARNILEGIAGNVLAAPLLVQLTRLLG